LKGKDDTMRAVLSMVDARYRCTGCGDCCRGWDVPLQPGEAQKFEALAAPLIPAARLKGAIATVEGTASSSGAPSQVLSARGRSCAALADDQSCVVHARHGGDQKPLACRIFPFTFVQAKKDVYVGLSFACPAVVDGEGPLLEEQVAEIRALWEGGVRGSRYVLQVPDPTPLADEISVPWSQAQVLIDDVAGAFAEPAPLERQVCRAGALVAITGEKLREGLAFCDALECARETADAMVTDVLRAPLEIDRLSRAMLRTVLRSTEPQSGTARRISGIFSSLLGGGTLRLRPSAPGEQPVELAWRDAERVPAVLPAEGEALLSRWFSVSLNGLTFFGDAAFGLSIAGGLDLCALSCAVTAFLARAQAAAAGRDRVSLDDCKRALRQFDAGVMHRARMPDGFARALAGTASLDLLREQLGR
jgi:lysine-N-methylase